MFYVTLVRSFAQSFGGLWTVRRLSISRTETRLHLCNMPVARSAR